MPSPAEVTEVIFGLYRRLGEKEYLGEEVCQREHAIQAALCAERDGQPHQVILGAFLHDVGHLIEDTDEENKMVHEHQVLGVTGHEKVGEKFLQNLGVRGEVTDFCRGHVDAKRYLCWKNKDYHDKLSNASKMTLVLQGGPMDETEALAFEKKPNFDIIIRARSWDEEAKVAGLMLPEISKYEKMFLDYFEMHCLT